jgi:diketogulonate reductase-like aldo/keto reductase
MSDSVKTKEVQGVEVPTLGLGTWRLDGDDCVEAVAHALEIGYRHVDTAQMYGNEEAVGRGIARSGVPRDEIWLTTKVWMENAAFDDVLRSTEASLRRLDVEHVDLLLLHWPNA